MVSEVVMNDINTAKSGASNASCIVVSLRFASQCSWKTALSFRRLDCRSSPSFLAHLGSFVEFLSLVEWTQHWLMRTCSLSIAVDSSDIRSGVDSR